MRLLKNKLLMFNNVSTIFYILGSSGYITFLSKYMEVQFNRTSSNATIVTGPLTVIAMVTGFLASGYLISKYKPRPRILFFWNVLVGISYMIGQISYIFLSCDSGSTLTMNSSSISLAATCNSNCFCDTVSYNPVCHLQSGTTFYSPCHAGCKTFIEDDKTYTHCSCVNELDIFNSSLALRQHTRINNTLSENMVLMETSKILSPFSTTTEKVLIFQPINAVDEQHRTTLYDIYDEVDTEEFDITEHKMSQLDKGNDEYDAYEYDDSQENSTADDTVSGMKRSKRASKNSRINPEAFDSFDSLGLVPGACLAGCTFALYAYTIISLIINWLGATGRIANILLNFR